MNSLAYLSRQFDVLASAKTPPSTPSTELSSFIGDRRTYAGSEPPLQRVNTWSTKSILFPPSSTLAATGPKRSFSTPAFASLQRLALPSGSSSSPVPETQHLSKPHIESIVRRIFFIRVFVLVWDNLRTAWSSLVRTEKLAIQPSPMPLEKETEVATCSKDDGRMVSDSSTRVSTLPQTTPLSLSLPVSRIEIDTDTEPLDTKSVHQATSNHSLSPSRGPSVAPNTSESSNTTSRSSTPVPATRKTPFHLLPKTLVLDLDETLIHSTSRPIAYTGGGSSGLFGLGSFGSRNKGVSHTVEVVLGGKSTLYHVYKRPFVDFFLRTASKAIWLRLLIR